MVSAYKCTVEEPRNLHIIVIFYGGTGVHSANVMQELDGSAHLIYMLLLIISSIKA